MVWNTTQSALYKAIDAFNNGEKTGEDQGENRNTCGCSETVPEAVPKKPENNGENNGNCMGCPQLPCGQCPACQRRSPATLSKLFSDNDMLLIAGLILILSRQNADRKLILALAFVLLT